MLETINDEVYEKYLIKAHYLMKCGIIHLDLFQLADLLYKVEIEKINKDTINDQKICYNDEIVSIDEFGLQDTIDISITGDNLFYCNGILTKNSMGLAHTADFMFSIIINEEMEKLGQALIKQLKNRYSDAAINKKFAIGLDKSKMKFYDLTQKAQKLSDSGQEEDVFEHETAEDSEVAVVSRKKFNEWQ
jgi:hypothetical protein